MTKLELARNCAKIGDTENAVIAYEMALKKSDHSDLMTDMECAAFILQNNGDYKLAYKNFINLYNNKFMQQEVFAVLTGAFYFPNLDNQRKLYDKNTAALNKYPYILKKEFPSFQNLKTKYFPFDDDYYIPFNSEKNIFDECVDINEKQIKHNFFKDLEKPILAENIFSYYELSYLFDNVRKSEDIARENHIYMHYDNFEDFCSFLQIADISKLLTGKKIVLLFDEEKKLYPIDFKDKFGIDYSQSAKKKISIRDITRLIYSPQISSHNGGDFFNEVFDSHPNLLMLHSTMFFDIDRMMNDFKKKYHLPQFCIVHNEEINNVEIRIFPNKYLKGVVNPTKKDFFVAYAMGINDGVGAWDKNSRIFPAVYIQPHFHNIFSNIEFDERGIVKITDNIGEQVATANYLYDFKYIKTFAPLRRLTTSYGATIKYKLNQIDYENHIEQKKMLLNELAFRMAVSTFRVDYSDALYKDCRLVRFEDGKLNPKATFTSLCEFLDLPYTDSLSYCSRYGVKNALSEEGADIGFSTASVYRKYEDYASFGERYILEYMAQDAMKKYGYNFECYDNEEMTAEKAIEILEKCEIFTNLFKKNIFELCKANNYNTVAIGINGESYKYKKEFEDEKTLEEKIEDTKKLVDNFEKIIRDQNFKLITSIKPDMPYINALGHKLELMEMIEPKKELLVKEIYR